MSLRSTTSPDFPPSLSAPVPPRPKDEFLAAEVPILQGLLAPLSLPSAQVEAGQALAAAGVPLVRTLLPMSSSLASARMSAEGASTELVPTRPQLPSEQPLSTQVFEVQPEEIEHKHPKPLLENSSIVTSTGVVEPVVQTASLAGEVREKEVHELEPKDPIVLQEDPLWEPSFSMVALDAAAAAELVDDSLLSTPIHDPPPLRMGVGTSSHSQPSLTTVSDTTLDAHTSTAENYYQSSGTHCSSPSAVVAMMEPSWERLRFAGMSEQVEVLSPQSTQAAAPSTFEVPLAVERIGGTVCRLPFMAGVPPVLPPLPVQLSLVVDGELATAEASRGASKGSIEEVFLQPVSPCSVMPELVPSEHLGACPTSPPKQGEPLVFFASAVTRDTGSCPDGGTFCCDEYRQDEAFLAFHQPHGDDPLKIGDVVEAEADAIESRPRPPMLVSLGLSPSSLSSVPAALSSHSQQPSRGSPANEVSLSVALGEVCSSSHLPSTSGFAVQRTPAAAVTTLSESSSVKLSCMESLLLLAPSLVVDVVGVASPARRVDCSSSPANVSPSVREASSFVREPVVVDVSVSSPETSVQIRNMLSTIVPTPLIGSGICGGDAELVSAPVSPSLHVAVACQIGAKPATTAESCSGEFDVVAARRVVMHNSPLEAPHQQLVSLSPTPSRLTCQTHAELESVRAARILSPAADFHLEDLLPQASGQLFSSRSSKTASASAPSSVEAVLENESKLPAPPQVPSAYEAEVAQLEAELLELELRTKGPRPPPVELVLVDAATPEPPCTAGLALRSCFAPATAIEVKVVDAGAGVAAAVAAVASEAAAASAAVAALPRAPLWAARLSSAGSSSPTPSFAVAAAGSQLSPPLPLPSSGSEVICIAFDQRLLPGSLATPLAPGSPGTPSRVSPPRLHLADDNFDIPWYETPVPLAPAAAAVTMVALEGSSRGSPTPRRGGCSPTPDRMGLGILGIDDDAALDSVMGSVAASSVQVIPRKAAFLDGFGQPGGSADATAAALALRAGTVVASTAAAPCRPTSPTSRDTPRIRDGQRRRPSPDVLPPASRPPLAMPPRAPGGREASAGPLGAPAGIGPPSHSNRGLQRSHSQHLPREPRSFQGVTLPALIPEPRSPCQEGAVEPSVAARGPGRSSSRSRGLPSSSSTPALRSQSMDDVEPQRKRLAHKMEVLAAVQASQHAGNMSMDQMQGLLAQLQDVRGGVKFDLNRHRPPPPPIMPSRPKPGAPELRSSGLRGRSGVDRAVI